MKRNVTRYDDLRTKWLALVEGLPVLLETDVVVDLAERLFEAYARHDDPPRAPDALIAAAAMTYGRVVVTENWKDFHFVGGLRYLDVRRVSLAMTPVLEDRVPKDRAIHPTAGCCRRLRRASGDRGNASCRRGPSAAGAAAAPRSGDEIALREGVERPARG